MIINRILQIIEYKNINKNKFYKETGLSNGFLDKVKDIGASKIEYILETYPDINPEWLLTGKGGMLKTEIHYTQEKTIKKSKVAEDEVNSLKEKIVSLENQIELLKENISLQKEMSELKDFKISKLEKQVEHLKKLLSSTDNKRRASSGE